MTENISVCLEKGKGQERHYTKAQGNLLSNECGHYRDCGNGFTVYVCVKTYPVVHLNRVQFIVYDTSIKL